MNPSPLLQQKPGLAAFSSVFCGFSALCLAVCLLRSLLFAGGCNSRPFLHQFVAAAFNQFHLFSFPSSNSLSELPPSNPSRRQVPLPSSPQQRDEAAAVCSTGVPRFLLCCCTLLNFAHHLGPPLVLGVPLLVCSAVASLHVRARSRAASS